MLKILRSSIALLLVVFMGAAALAQTEGGQSNTLGAPEDLQAQPDEAQEIRLTWSDPRYGRPDGYHVYRSEGSDEDFQVLAEVFETRFQDDGLVPGERYYYFVRGFQADESGPASETASAVASRWDTTHITADEGISVETWALYKPATPEVEIDTNEEDLPGLCEFELCRTSVTIPAQSVGVPASGSIEIVIPEIYLERKCSAALCVGPIDSDPLEILSLDGTDSFEGNIQPITLPAACDLAPEICTGLVTIPGINADLVGGTEVAQLTPPARLSVGLEDFSAYVAPHVGESRSIDPIALIVELPWLGDLPVTLCPEGCPSAVLPTGELTGSIEVTLEVGDVSYTEDIPFSFEL